MQCYLGPGDMSQHPTAGQFAREIRCDCIGDRAKIDQAALRNERYPVGRVPALNGQDVNGTLEAEARTVYSRRPPPFTREQMIGIGAT